MPEPTTVERDRVPPASLELSPFVITVVSGASAGATLTIDPSMPARVFVGTSEACHLRVEDPLVSRRHLALSLESNGVRLLDLKSTNGTAVNGLRAFEVLLAGGEAIALGDTLLSIRAAGPPVRARVSPAARFGRVIGGSPAMRRLYPLCERLALSDVPVILEGETGTGKELLAEAIHESSPRASGPFVVFDCTIGPPTLLESTLFGHERGAFTGAEAARAGVFEQARGGTLFIDEIGDLDVALQAKLLRALQRGEVQRLGSSTWTKTDARILAATRRDLEHEVQAGRFRDDLYYRLAVARVELPPLRRRAGDVPLIAQEIWRSLTKAPMPADFLERLEGYDWPGNVRELGNAVAHQVALGELAQVEGLRRRGSSPPPSDEAPQGDVVARVIGEDLPFLVARGRVVEDFERRYVEHVLQKHQGNVSRAAAASGIARRYFYTVRARSER